MKIKKQFSLQKIADEFLIVPIGEEADRLHGIIKLNSTGLFLWELMSHQDISKEELIDCFASEYNINRETAQNDVIKFLKTICDLKCLE